MNSKFLRFSFLVFQLLVFILGIGICIFGLVKTDTLASGYRYLTAVARIIILLLVSATYFKMSGSSFSQGSAFMMLCIFCLSFAELRVLSDFTLLTGISIMPPRAIVRTQLMSQFLMHICLIGYALYYQNSEYTSSTRFILFGIGASVFLALVIPSSQTLPGMWLHTAPLLILSVLAVLTLFTHILLSSSEPTTMGSLRHVAIMLMVIGNYINTVFPGMIPAIIGTGLFAIGGIIAVTVTLRNSVIL